MNKARDMKRIFSAHTRFSATGMVQQLQYSTRSR